MYLVNLRSGWKLWWSILFSIMLIVGWAITPAQAHCKGKHTGTHEHCTGSGGGEDPPPPDKVNPAIAYVVENRSTGNWDDMMVMDADGSNKTVVVEGGFTRPVSPSWSPDGKSLVFSYLFNGECSGLHIVSMDESGRWGTPEPLQIAGECIRGWIPAWSPDNSETNTVVFDGGTDLSIVKFQLDQDGLVSVIEGPDLLSGVEGIYETEPTWSPAGSKVAFIEADTQTSPFIFDLVVLDLNKSPGEIGYSQRPIPLDSPLSDSGLGSISWAKTQDLLIIEVGSYSSRDLWCIDLSDESQVNLTKTFDDVWGVQNDVGPSWSPDDSEIIFSRGGIAMALTIDTTNGCPDAVAVENAALREVARAKGKKTMWDFDWWRGAQ